MDLLRTTLLAEAAAQAGPDNAGLVDVVPGTCTEVGVKLVFVIHDTGGSTAHMQAVG
jgi:hypothetical protein